MCVKYPCLVECLQDNLKSMRQITQLTRKHTGTFLCYKISFDLLILSNSYFQKSHHHKSHLIRVHTNENFLGNKRLWTTNKNSKTHSFLLFILSLNSVYITYDDAWSHTVFFSLPYNCIKPQLTDVGISHTIVPSMFSLMTKFSI